MGFAGKVHGAAEYRIIEKETSMKAAQTVSPSNKLLPDSTYPLLNSLKSIQRGFNTSWTYLLRVNPS
jgi:hypothetical protein